MYPWPGPQPRPEVSITPVEERVKASPEKIKLATLTVEVMRVDRLLEKEILSEETEPCTSIERKEKEREQLGQVREALERMVKFPWPVNTVYVV